VKLGVLLPTFQSSAEPALATAARVADEGLDGVFAYDHLWPMGSPERPALAPFPVLAAAAARQSTLVVGPLVARVGLGDATTVTERIRSLLLVAPGRVIAALGTGDHLSKAENLAYGLAYPRADERRAQLSEIILTLREQVPVWCGAGSDATNRLARELDVTLNVWAAEPARVRALALEGPVSWAGPLGDDPRARLDELRDAGATWAVAGPPFDLAVLGEWRRAQ